ncbi:MAG TPA: LysE family transporter [Propionibacteriaceae bacterium]|nr:LysE family transporter [Propionibacteriaceae bacterium]
MISDFASGALAGLAVAMPIGAIGAYLVALGARERIAVATAAALGVASVDGGYAIIAVLGGVGLQTALRETAGWLDWVAATALVAVAVRTIWLAVRRYRGSSGGIRQPRGLTPARAYLSLLALTAVNPATLITFAAVAVGRSASGGGSTPLSVTLFAVGAFAASALWQLLLTGGGNLLGRLFTGRRGQLAVSACSASIMLCLSVGLLLR